MNPLIVRSIYHNLCRKWLKIILGIQNCYHMLNENRIYYRYSDPNLKMTKYYRFAAGILLCGYVCVFLWLQMSSYKVFVHNKL